MANHRKGPMRWFKNGDGKEDAVLSMTWLGFLVIITRVAVGGLTINAFGQSLAFPQVDSGLVAAILTPTLGAYVAHQYNAYKSNPFYIKKKMDINGDGVEENVVVAPEETEKKA